MLSGLNAKNGKNRQKEKRNGHGEHQCTAPVYEKCQDHSAKHDERTAQEQPQAHVQPGLYLIHIAGKAGNQGAGAEPVQLAVGQRLDMVKKRLAQCLQTLRLLWPQNTERQRCRAVPPRP